MNCREESGKYILCEKCEAEKTVIKAPTVIYKGKGFTKNDKQKP